MISPEFKAAIKGNNLLRTRIMLKDSFVLDPTFAQLEEMLAYARQYLPDLLVPFDKGTLENDTEKWDKAVMNEELVGLVTNFSEERIRHLKEVVSKVLGAEAEKLRQQRNRLKNQNPDSQKSNHYNEAPKNVKEKNRHKALGRLSEGANKIELEMKQVKQPGGWRSWRRSSIDKIEEAAKEILSAVQDYRKNK